MAGEIAFSSPAAVEAYLRTNSHVFLPENGVHYVPGPDTAHEIFEGINNHLTSGTKVFAKHTHYVSPADPTDSVGELSEFMQTEIIEPLRGLQAYSADHPRIEMKMGGFFRYGNFMGDIVVADLAVRRTGADQISITPHVELPNDSSSDLPWQASLRKLNGYNAQTINSRDREEKAVAVLRQEIVVLPHPVLAQMQADLSAGNLNMPLDMKGAVLPDYRRGIKIELIPFLMDGQWPDPEKHLLPSHQARRSEVTQK